MAPAEFPDTTSLCAYWKMDEASGTRNDSFGTNHLTDVNTVGSVAGKISNAAEIRRGSAEYLTIADNAVLSLGSSDMTITAWVYHLTKPASPNCIVSKYQSGTNEYLLYYDQGTDRYRLLVYTSGSLVWVTASTFGSPSTATWYFLCATFTLSTVTGRLSVNNGTMDSASGSGVPNDSTQAFTLGANAGGTETLDGYIDEVSFWKRVLTTNEITDLYNGGAGLTYTPAVTQSQAPRSLHRYRLARV